MRSHLRIGLLALCAGGLTLTPAAFATDPVKIGVVVSPSGPHAPQAREGLEIALKTINDSGGVLGRPFELVFRENQGAADQAAAAIEGFVQQKVTALIGGEDAASALAAVEVAHQHKVPYITDVASHAVGAKLYPEVYNVGLSNSQIAAVIADNIKALGGKRVIAFTPNSDAGIERANQLAQRLNSSESGVQYAFETLDPAATDFATVLQPHRSNPPDTVVLMLQPPAAYVLLKQMRQQGIAPSARARIYDTSGLINDPAFWDNAKDSATGMLVLAQYHPKMTLTDLGTKVAEAYRTKTGKEPSGTVLTAADELFVLAEAIKSGGSSEPEAITKALESLKWTGTRGKVVFSPEKEDAKYHQWLDVPVVTFQITASKQPLGETKLVQPPGQPLDAAAVQTSQ